MRKLHKSVDADVYVVEEISKDQFGTTRYKVIASTKNFVDAEGAVLKRLQMHETGKTNPFKTGSVHYEIEQPHKIYDGLVRYYSYSKSLGTLICMGYNSIEDPTHECQIENEDLRNYAVA